MDTFLFLSLWNRIHQVEDLDNAVILQMPQQI